MKAIEAIKQLQELDPNEEIVIMYWTKELFDDNYDEDNAISTNTWNEMVKIVEDRDYLDGASSEAYEVIEANLRELGHE